MGHIAAFGATALTSSRTGPLKKPSRSIHDRPPSPLVEGVTVDERGLASNTYQARQNVKALAGLAASLSGQIIVLGSRNAEPSTVREALATIVRLMQHSVKGIAPAGLVALLGQVGGEHLDPMKLVGLAGQFL